MMKQARLKYQKAFNQYKVIVQVACTQTGLPRVAWFQKWAQTALATLEAEKASCTLRIVGLEEMTSLNERYRGKSGPTNVLSFPSDLLIKRISGDIVLCRNLIEQEALVQKKRVMHHFAHLIVHGILHLAGYDHDVEAKAAVMEALEVRILGLNAYPNPYI